jgi:hypothetical protein
MGNNKSRKDDIESAIYVMFKMIYGKLPWDNIIDKYCDQLTTFLSLRLNKKYNEKLYNMIACKPLFI